MKRSKPGIQCHLDEPTTEDLNRLDLITFVRTYFPCCADVTMPSQLIADWMQQRSGPHWPHWSDWLPGDIVSRDGTDEHEIVKIDYDLITVRCTKAPATGWADVGDEESNLSRRYDFVYRPSADRSSVD